MMGSTCNIPNLRSVFCAPFLDPDPDLVINFFLALCSFPPPWLLVFGGWSLLLPLAGDVGLKGDLGGLHF